MGAYIERLSSESAGWLVQALQLVTSVVAQELKELSRLGGDTGITLQPDENNIHVWKAYIKVCCFLDQGLWYAIELRTCNTPRLTRLTAHSLCCLVAVELLSSCGYVALACRAQQTRRSRAARLSCC